MESHNTTDLVPHLNSHDAHSDGASGSPAPSSTLSISPYTQALLKVWNHPAVAFPHSASRISVSQTVSFAAFLYEKMRNAIEFREDHLVRRAAIERILRRRMILNENGRDIAEPLIKELLWARYYENNTIGENMIAQVQTRIDKYFFLRNEMTRGRKRGDQERIADFILQCLSCDIQELLSPNPRNEAFINYTYQILRPQISTKNFDDETNRDIQTFIAIEKMFAHNDPPHIRYHLLKIMIPEITKGTWKTSESILPQMYEVYSIIEKQINHPMGDKTKNVIKKQVAPYLILRDIFEQYPAEISSIVSDDKLLKQKVDDVCRKRYEASGRKLRTLGIRSFIYILLTKVVFAFAIELPYDLYVQKTIDYIPLIINIIFPPLLMSVIIFTVSMPGDDNTRRIYQLIKTILIYNPSEQSDLSAGLIVGRKRILKGGVSNMVFSFLYSLMYLVTFGSIIYVLSLLDFNPVSQAIFIFFVTLVTFFAFRVIQITQEYQVVIRDSIFTPIVDFYFLPIIRVGQWLSGEVLQRFNFLMFIFDFFIELPFKALVEIFDEWIRFVRIKKEEIV